MTGNNSKKSVNAEDVTRHKPDPAPYLLAAEKLGTLKDQGFVIEDSPSGIKAAKGAGFTVVALGTSMAKEFLMAAGADKYVKSYQELKVLLDW